jgi:hypothetical protein
MEDDEDIDICTNCWIEPAFFINSQCMYCVAAWIEFLEGDDDEEASEIDPEE